MNMSKDIVFGIARHLLTTLGGALAAAHPGIIGTADVDAAVGGIVAIAGVIWSIVEKSRRA